METVDLILIAQARTDSISFMVLFKQYEPLVRKTLMKYYLNGFDHDDWLQEAQIALHKALVHYDGSQGSKFGAFYQLVLRSHLSSLVRLHLAKKRQGDLLTFSVPDVGVLRTVFGTTDTQLEARVLLRQGVLQLAATLSDLERQALLTLVLPLPATTARLKRAQSRVRHKLRALLKEDPEAPPHQAQHTQGA